MSDNLIQQFGLQAAGEYPGLGLVFDVLINGQSLLAQVKAFEARYSDTINGAYTQTLGQRDIEAALSLQDTALMPYACDCGDYDCWMLFTKTASVGDYVYWHQWQNPHRSDKSKAAEGLYWSYKDFPHLCFDKDQYLNELQQALTLIKQGTNA